MRIADSYVVVGFGLLVGLSILIAGIQTTPAAQNEPQSNPVDPGESTIARTNRGLLVLYDFASATGAVVKDRSGAGEPIDLYVVDPQSVRRSEGTLEIRRPTLIRSERPATKIINAVRRSGAFTVEAWIRPAKTDQEGPARIVTLSKNANERNFTLGQEDDHFEVRFRTSKTSSNGIPAVSSPSRTLTTRLTHVVYSRERSGRTRIYIDGKQRGEKTIAGATGSWAKDFRLALGNELSDARPWLGTYSLVAIYSRALTPSEVQRHFKSGAGASTATELAENRRSRFFETSVAPLFARHCLECHDSASRKGKLDLSRKVAALAGGENGEVVIAGKSAESLLWKHVESDAMPADRSPLSAQEKKLLQKWIDDGAVWSLETIDAAVYAHEGNGSRNWVRRLTIPEYIETVRSAVGVDVSKEAREILPPDLRADGFSNTAYNLNVDLKHVDAYAKLAEIIVGRMDVGKFAARFSRSRKFTDDDMGKLISGMGKWLLRGPLEEREVVAFRGISTSVAAAGGKFDEAVGFMIEAMLQSPRFIYLIENQTGDGSDWPVSDYELASRLSYIIWGGPPDAALMKAADSNELADQSALAAHVSRMLDDPRTIKQSTRFVHEWLNLGRLENLNPDPKKFPNWNRRLATDMRRETIAFFQEVCWEQKRPLSDLLNAQVTFASPELAKHYGLRAKADGQSRYDLGGVAGRGGLLTQGSVLTVGGDEASMVTRGLFVLHDLLRGVVKDPPPCVDTTPVPTKAGLTQRGIAVQRLANKACGGCHSKFEPLAFGLEKFDGLGAFHEEDEHGNRLRDDGEILIPGSAGSVKYESAAKLMDLLAESDRVKETMTWKVTQFSLGRPLGAKDARIVGKIHAAAQKGGGTYSSLITAIVMSDLVRMTRTEQTD